MRVQIPYGVPRALCVDHTTCMHRHSHRAATRLLDRPGQVQVAMECTDGDIGSCDEYDEYDQVSPPEYDHVSPSEYDHASPSEYDHASPPCLLDATHTMRLGIPRAAIEKEPHVEVQVCMYVIIKNELRVHTYSR